MATNNELSRWQNALAPAFVWDAERNRIVWANAAAVAWFGAASLGDLVERVFGAREPAVIALAEAARKLRQPDDCCEVELHFISVDRQEALPARVCHHELSAGRKGLLIVADHASQSLLPQSSLLAELLRDLPSAVAAMDANGALLYANPKALDMVGEEGLAGLSAFFPSPVEARAFLLRALEAGAATALRQANTAYGLRQIRLFARPTQDSGHLILTLDDLTDRLAAERQGVLGGVSAASLSMPQIDLPAAAPTPDVACRQPSAGPKEESAPRETGKQRHPSHALSAEELEILRRIAETLAPEKEVSLELRKDRTEEEAKARPASPPEADVPQQEDRKPLPASSSSATHETDAASGADEAKNEEKEEQRPASRRITIRRRALKGQDASRPEEEESPNSSLNFGHDVASAPAREKLPGRAGQDEADTSAQTPVDAPSRETFPENAKEEDRQEAERKEEQQPPLRPEVPALVRQVMDQQLDPVILHRADAFFYANRAARELFGFELEDEAWDTLASSLMRMADGGEIELPDASGQKRRFVLKRDAFPWQSGVVVQSTLKLLQEAPPHHMEDTLRKAASSTQKKTGGEVAGESASGQATASNVTKTEPLASSRSTLLLAGKESGPLLHNTRRQQADVIRLHVSRAVPVEKKEPQPKKADMKESSEDACNDVQIDAELRALLDTAADGIMTLNAAGRILSFSSGASRLFGLSAHEVIGRQFTELFAERDRAAIEDYLASLKAAARPGEGREVSGLTKDGEEIPLFLTIGRLRHGRLLEHEDHASYCVVVRDLSVWKRKESELVRAKEAAERASAQKSEFLAMISHELRTPLNAILGFADVLRQQMFGKLGNEKYLDYARDIYESGEHLLSLINDLLDLSRIEAGRFELDFVEVDLGSIVEETVHTMREQIAASGVQVRTAIPRRLPKVVADVRSMKQIMFNLLSNAIKFCNEGDLVTITLAKKDDGSVELLVRDTGPGMTREELANALEPFRRNRKEGGDQPPGTGLGLPLTKALAEANKAQFAIDSEPGRGTEVRITFPPHRVLI